MCNRDHEARCRRKIAEQALTQSGNLFGATVGIERPYATPCSLCTLCRSPDACLSRSKTRTFFSGHIWHERFANRFARIDSRESFAIEIPIFKARQGDSPESLEFPIRANHLIRANRANRFARITPLSLATFWGISPNLVDRTCVDI